VGEVKLWWKPIKKIGSTDKILKPLILNSHAMELAMYAENTKEEVDIYVDHVVNSVQVVELIEGSTSEGVNVDVQD